MKLLDDATFGEIQRMTESAMPDTFAPDEPGDWVADGSGGGYSAPTPGASYPCRKMEPLEAERFLAGQQQIAGTAALVLPLDSPVGTEAVGTYTRTRTGETTRYSVTGTRTGSYTPHLVLIVAPAATQGA